MDNKPLVSIIIPTFNRVNYTRVAIKSALAQTYTNTEILVSDDSTNDEVKKMINEEFASPKIKYYRNQGVRGIVNNVKNALSYANGDYISFLNDDDCWCPEFLDTLTRELIIREDTVCAFCDHWIMDENGVVNVEKTNKNTHTYKRDNLGTGLIPYQDNLNLYLDYSVPIAMASVIKLKSVDVNGLPLEVGGAYDKWIFLHLILSNGSFYYINERLTYYRVHEQNATATQKVKVLKSVLFVLDKSIASLKLDKFSKRVLLNQYRNYVNALIKAKNISFIRYYKYYIQSLLH